MTVAPLATQVRVHALDTRTAPLRGHALHQDSMTTAHIYVGSCPPTHEARPRSSARPSVTFPHGAQRIATPPHRAAGSQFKKVRQCQLHVRRCRGCSKHAQRTV